MKNCWLLILTLALVTTLHAQQDMEATKQALQTGGSTYFTAKIDNLTQQLQLTEEQQAKIRPIAEQETGYLEQIRGNSVLSRKEKLKKLEEVVKETDAQMKPMLSPEQWQKLQDLRKHQKSELKKYANEKS
ncbi:MAG TPA: hypothetical protein VH437_17835 [Terriglobales bacterium]